MENGSIALREGFLSGKGMSFTLVVSRFNSLICDRLEEGALDCLHRHGTDKKNINVIRVPGAFELPLAAQWACDENPNGVICLGAVIQGGTPHADYICSEVTKGVAQVSLKTGIPVGYGILTCETLEQALERAGSKSGNKGWEATISTLEMVNLRMLFKK